MKDIKIHMKKDGEPFVDEKAASLFAGKLKKQGIETRIVPFDNGFVLIEEGPTKQAKQRRRPLGKRNRLFVDDSLKEPGFEYRVVTDDEPSQRIRMFQEAGWELVKDTRISLVDDNVAIPQSTGANVSVPVGNSRTGYLMRIKEEYYNEDQLAKQNEIDKREAQMKRAKVSSKEALESGNTVYGGLSIGSNADDFPE